MLKKMPELHHFLSTSILDADPGNDEQVASSFASSASLERRRQVAQQLERLIALEELSLEDLGAEANRWFADADEAREWLRQLLAALKTDDGSGEDTGVVVKDSNGAVLSEGDSVTVIKDLKVKGGSSDLKRGTTIRKIHLTGDAEAIECRVDGSTLVLKTCFLKKA